MARQIADNYNYRAKKHLDERVEIAHLADLLTVEDAYYPDGFIVYCLEDMSYYQYMDKNAADAVTGKFTKIGNFVNHNRALVNGVPDIFVKSLGEIDEASTFPAAPNAGEYLTIKDTAVLPFTIAGVEFKHPMQCAYYDGTNWIAAVLPSEDAIHIFKQAGAMYTDANGATYPVKVNNKYKFAPKAVAAGFGFDPDLAGGSITNVKFPVRFSKGTAINVPLDSTAYYPNEATQIEIDENGVKIGSPATVYAWNDLTPEIIKSIDGYLVKKHLYSVALLDDDALKKIFVLNTSTMKYDSMSHFTIGYSSPQSVPLSMLNDDDDSMVFKMEALEVDETGTGTADDYPIAYISEYGDDRFVPTKAVTDDVTPAGFIFDAQGYWTKVFPADFEAIYNSPNPVANGVMTRAMSKLGKSFDISFNRDTKILTAVLKDGRGEELSKVAVTIGADESAAAPKVTKLNVIVDAFEKGTTGSTPIEVNVVKGDNPISKVVVVDELTGDEVYTWTAASTDPTTHVDPDAPEQMLVATLTNLTGDLDIVAKAYDDQSVYSTSADKIEIRFVDACYYNPDGSAIFTKLLYKTGCGEFVFNFMISDTPGVDPILSSKAAIRVPKALGGIDAIIGGDTRGYLLADYTRSFEQNIMEIEGVDYIEWKLKEAVGLENFIFETCRREQN